MVDLPPDAKRLLALARDADNPPPGAREEVRRAALATLAAGGPSPTSLNAPPSGAQPWGLLGKLKVFLAAFTLAGVGLLGYRATHSEVASVEVRSAASPTSGLQLRPEVAPLLLQSPSVKPLLGAAAPPSVEASPPVHAPARAQRPAVRELPRLDLKGDMALLERATDALSHQRAQIALDLLAQHRARFATTAFPDERAGLTVIAHCQLGTASAAVEATGFLRSTPGSLLAARVRSACGVEGQPEHQPKETR
ncbi:MAG: hypothetical protein QM778_30495 [Myxococcales bacterium]